MGLATGHWAALQGTDVGRTTDKSALGLKQDSYTLPHMEGRPLILLGFLTPASVQAHMCKGGCGTKGTVPA